MNAIKSILLALVLTSLVFGGVTFDHLNAYAEETRIVLQWTTGMEEQISGFEIQRSTDGQNYTNIGFIEAQGHGAGYTFIDDSIIAKVSGRSYQYRLKVWNLDGTTEYSEIMTVQSQISSVQHSWGSLKALFK